MQTIKENWLRTNILYSRLFFQLWHTTRTKVTRSKPGKYWLFK